MSISHILLIAVVALVLFGPSKLPELGRAIGRTMREFKKGAEGLLDDVQASAPKEERKDVTPPAPDPVSELLLPPASSAAEQQVQPVQPANGAQPVQPVQNAQPEQQAQGSNPAQQEKPADPRRLPD